MGGHYHVRIITNGVGKKHANFQRDRAGAILYAKLWNAEFGTE